MKSMAAQKKKLLWGHSQITPAHKGGGWLTKKRARTCDGLAKSVRTNSDCSGILLN